MNLLFLHFFCYFFKIGLFTYQTYPGPLFDLSNLVKISDKPGRPLPSYGPCTFLESCVCLKAICMHICADIYLQPNMSSINGIGPELLQWFYDQVPSNKLVWEAKCIAVYCYSYDEFLYFPYHDQVISVCVLL